jgi:hypothetical protein
MTKKRGAKWEWAHTPQEAVTATIIPWDGRLGVSYTYLNGSAEAGPIGPADWTVIAALERDGKVSFANQNIRKRFLKLRGLSGRDH